MENKEVKEKIVEILDRTFEVLDKCYDHNVESSNKPDSYKVENRLIFPSYSKTFRNGICRISEQELRFAFIEQFILYCQDQKNSWNAFYSVETPTQGRYSFKNGKPKRDDDKGRSANIDVCIHDETGERICLIEFKALNPKQNDYLKDFVKLNEEKISPVFFVQLLKNQDRGTIKNIYKKIGSNLKNINYVCHTLNSKNRRIEYISPNKIDREGWYELDLDNLS